MVAPPLRTIVPVVLCLLSLQSLAETAAPSTTAPRQWQSVTIGERSTELLIRFDRPINHQLSWIFLVRGGKVVATMHPRLGAAPNVLFVRIPTPRPGDYVVRWVVCPAGTDDKYGGEFPMTVGRKAASTAEGPL